MVQSSVNSYEYECKYMYMCCVYMCTRLECGVYMCVACECMFFPLTLSEPDHGMEPGLAQHFFLQIINGLVSNYSSHWYMYVQFINPRASTFTSRGFETIYFQTFRRVYFDSWKLACIKYSTIKNFRYVATSVYSLITFSCFNFRTLGEYPISMRNMPDIRYNAQAYI